MAVVEDPFDRLEQELKLDAFLNSTEESGQSELEAWLLDSGESTPDKEPDQSGLEAWLLGEEPQQEPSRYERHPSVPPHLDTDLTSEVGPVPSASGEEYDWALESGRDSMTHSVDKGLQVKEDTLSSLTPSPLTKEEILNNPKHMKTILDGMKIIHGERYAIWNRDFDEMGDDKLFEMWQNWQRRFNVGNSITAVNTLSKLEGLDEGGVAALGENFKLFDSMSGKGDLVDATWDYVTGAIFDPVTVMSMGLGKIATQAGSKAAVQTARSLAIAAANKILEKGGTQAAAREAGIQVMRQSAKPILLAAAKNVGISSVADIAAGIGTDVAVQSAKVKTGAQDEWSPAQTGFSVAASLGIPAIFVAGQGVKALSRSTALKGTAFESVSELLQATDISPEQVAKLSRAAANPKKISKGFKLTSDISWEDLKRLADEDIKNHGGTPVESGEKTAFMRFFLLGGEEGGGFIEALSKAGYVYNEKTDKSISMFIRGMSEFLDDKTVDKIAVNFEKIYGDTALPRLQGKTLIPHTRDELTRFIVRESEQAGSYFQVLSESRRLSVFSEADSLAAQAAKEADELQAVRATRTKEWWKATQYAQGVWKRLLTSHLSTTALNTRGWSALYTMNTLSDVALGMVQGTGYIVKKGLSGAFGSESMAQAAEVSKDNFKNSVFGAIRRGALLLNPDDTIEQARVYLSLDPSIEGKLFHTLSGDSGPMDAVKALGRNPNSPLIRGAEGYTNIAQTITGVKLQDEFTKLISFASAMDRGISKHYGMSPSEFWSRPDWFKLVQENKFKDSVMGYAVDRTLRETATRSFREGWAKAGFSPTKQIANAIEAASSAPGTGILIPFGKFFNNTMATAGDFSGWNLARHIGAKMAGKAIDPTTKDGMELMSNTLVGVSLLGFATAQAMERIELGLAYNENLRGDGSVADETFKWPGSTFRLLGQMMAHKFRRSGEHGEDWVIVPDGEVPPALLDEAKKIFLTQTFKESEEFVSAVFDIYDGLLGADPYGVGEVLLETVKKSASKFISGGMRTWDPVNEVLKFHIGEDYNQKDRRDNFMAQGLRYIDFLFTTGMAPGEEVKFPGTSAGMSVPYDRQSATRGVTQSDLTKQIGARTMPTATASEMVFNNLGIPIYKAVAQWKGPPEVSRAMNEIVFPFLETEIELMLGSDPDFFKRSYERRELMTKGAVGRARKAAEEYLNYNPSREVSDRVEILNSIANLTNKERNFKMDGIELGDFEELAKTPEGREQLRVFLLIVKNSEDLILNEQLE